MRFKPTFIAFILAALSVALMYYTLHVNGLGTASGGVAPGEDGLVALQQLPLDDVTKITLQRENEPRLVFEREAGRWEQREPFLFSMDLYSIRQLALQASQVARVGSYDKVNLDQSTSEESLGFNPPRATIDYEWPGGSLTLQLGRLVGAGRGYLRLVGSDDVFSVSHLLHQRAIQMNPVDWRNRRLFHDVSVEADSIERIVGDDRLLVRREEGQWRMIQPVTTRVNTLGLQQWIQSLETAQIASFVVDEPDDLSRLGLDPPDAVIILTSTNRVEVDGVVLSEQVVQKLFVGSIIGGQSSDRFAKIDGKPVVFRLSIEDQGRLFIRAGDIVAQTATGVTPPDVKRILVRSGDDELTIERDLDSWYALPDKQSIEPQFIGDLLRLIMELRPHTITLAPYPQDQEIGRITLLGFNLRPLDTVRIARDLETGQFILENGDGVLRYFPESVTLRLSARDFGIESPIEP